MKEAAFKTSGSELGTNSAIHISIELHSQLKLVGSNIRKEYNRGHNIMLVCIQIFITPFPYFTKIKLNTKHTLNNLFHTITV